MTNVYSFDILVLSSKGDLSMLRNKAYKFRLYPNKEQQILINKNIWGVLD